VVESGRAAALDWPRSEKEKGQCRTFQYFPSLRAHTRVGGTNPWGMRITDDQGTLHLVARIGDTIHTDSGDISVGGDFVRQDGTGRDGLSSSGNRRDHLAVFNSGVFSASYAYIVTVGTPAPSAPLTDFSLVGTGLKLSWPTGYPLEFTSTLRATTWSALTVSSLFVVRIANRRAFYRLTSP
jgi:hypothetical protein